MTHNIDDLKAAFCRYINTSGLDIKAFVAPLNGPVPEGNYISIRENSIQQIGRPFIPKPVDNPNDYEIRVSQVANILITEVEGNGTKLRAIKNLLETESFLEFSKLNDFSLWEISNINTFNSQDGDFWIRQQAFSIRVNFMDTMPAETCLTKSVSGTLNKEDFKTEIKQ